MIRKPRRCSTLLPDHPGDINYDDEADVVSKQAGEPNQLVRTTQNEVAQRVDANRFDLRRCDAHSHYDDRVWFSTPIRR